jgi:excisionase family DNA binding protein
MEKLLLTPSEAAPLIGLGVAKLKQLLLSGEIASVKIGRSRKIPVSALEDYAAKIVSEQLKVQV